MMHGWEDINPSLGIHHGPNKLHLCGMTGTFGGIILNAAF
jgi:hypothetical protein